MNASCKRPGVSLLLIHFKTTTCHQSPVTSFTVLPWSNFRFSALIDQLTADRRTKALLVHAQDSHWHYGTASHTRWLVSGQYTSVRDVTVRDLLSLATLVGRHTSKLTVLFLVTIRKPLELNRPGMFPTSSQTKGATASEWRVTAYPVLSCRTSACRETGIFINQWDHKCDAISNLEHKFLILYESFGGGGNCLQSQLKRPLTIPLVDVPPLASCIISAAVWLPFNKVSYCDVGFLESLSIFGWAEEVVVGGTLLAAAVLQVKGEQAGEAGTASTSCQQGGDRLFKNSHGAGRRDQALVGLQCADWIQISPRVHSHLTNRPKL